MNTSAHSDLAQSIEREESKSVKEILEMSYAVRIKEVLLTVRHTDPMNLIEKYVMRGYIDYDPPLGNDELADLLGLHRVFIEAVVADLCEAELLSERTDGTRLVTGFGRECYRRKEIEREHMETAWLVMDPLEGKTWLLDEELAELDESYPALEDCIKLKGFAKEFCDLGLAEIVTMELESNTEIQDIDGGVEIVDFELQDAEEDRQMVVYLVITVDFQERWWLEVRKGKKLAEVKAFSGLDQSEVLELEKLFPDTKPHFPVLPRNTLIFRVDSSGLEHPIQAYIESVATNGSMWIGWQKLQDEIFPSTLLAILSDYMSSYGWLKLFIFDQVDRRIHQARATALRLNDDGEPLSIPESKKAPEYSRDCDCSAWFKVDWIAENPVEDLSGWSFVQEPKQDEAYGNASGDKPIGGPEAIAKVEDRTIFFIKPCLADVSYEEGDERPTMKSILGFSHLLLVEGEHDRRFLETYFDSRLAERYIKVLPFGGILRNEDLMDLLDWLDTFPEIRKTVIVDNGRSELVDILNSRYTTGASIKGNSDGGFLKDWDPTAEERFLEEIKASNPDTAVYAFHKRDICMYIPMQVMRDITSREDLLDWNIVEEEMSDIGRHTERPTDGKSASMYNIKDFFYEKFGIFIGKALVSDCAKQIREMAITIDEFEEIFIALAG